MPKFARVVRNVALDVCTNPTELFHPDLAKMLLAVPEYVENGWVLNNGVWTGMPTAQGPTAEQVKNIISLVIQKKLDDFAKTKGYDSILSACSYTTSINESFRAQAQYCVQTRDDTWTMASKIWEEVVAGTRTAPTSLEDIESDLPSLTWPD